MGSGYFPLKGALCDAKLSRRELMEFLKALAYDAGAYGRLVYSDSCQFDNAASDGACLELLSLARRFLGEVYGLSEEENAELKAAEDEGYGSAW